MRLVNPIMLLVVVVLVWLGLMILREQRECAARGGHIIYEDYVIVGNVIGPSKSHCEIE